ncbi:MAG: hypothetical protein R2941_17250 [Desulfobacterales bacterium]
MSSQMKKFYAVCVSVLCFVCLPAAGWADTNVSGAVSANTVWNAAETLPAGLPAVCTGAKNYDAKVGMEESICNMQGSAGLR